MRKTEEIVRRIFVIALLIAACIVKTHAQTYPVQVNTQILAPYSPFLTDYTEVGAQRFIVNFRLNDPTLPEYRGKLRLTIEGVGITIRTKQNFIPQQPLILQGGGIPLILYGEDLEEYFNPNNLDFAGLSKNQYEKGAKLPEGVYRFTVEVLDYNRNTVVSNKGTAIAWIILNDPVLLNLPRNESKAAILDPTNIAFTWTPRHTGSPNSAFTTEYIFKLVEIWPASRNPYDAFLSQQPLYETTTSSTQIVYGPAEPALIPGRKYAWQVQAKDTEGRDLFKNEGKSEVYTFQFGDEIGIPQNFRKDGGNASVINLRWEPAPNGAIPQQYRVRYRKKNNRDRDGWYESVTPQLWIAVPDLQRDTEYEMQIRAEAAPQYSEYSQSTTFKTSASEPVLYECGKEDVLIPVSTSSVLMGLPPGTMLTAAGHKIKVIQATGSNGDFTGEGWMYLSYLKGAGVRITFSGQINSDYEFTNLAFETVYNKGSVMAQAVDDANNIGNDTNEFFDKKDSAAIVKSDYTVPGTIDNIYVKDDGKIIVVDTEGNESTFESKKDAKTGKTKETVIADAAGNSYTVGEDGKVTKGTGGSTASPVAASVSSEEDALMQEIIQFYLDEITAYLTANPQYDKGPYYSDEVVKVLEDLPTCLQTRASDIAYIKRYLKHLQNDQNDRTDFVNLIRKSVAAFAESVIKTVEARNKPGNTNKKLKDLLPIEDWNLVTNGMCEYLIVPAQEYHITKSVEKTFKTEGDCFTRALKRGMEVKTSFDMAAYAALIEVGLCLTEKGNCAGTGYWSQFSCGVANGLVQELDVVAMGEGVATLLITQVKNKYNCIADGDLIDVVAQEPTMEQAVHSYSKCILGFDMTLDEWKKLYSTVEKYVATNWQDPYLHGQATVFVASLVIPVTKLSKVKLLSKLRLNPNFVDKVDELAKLSEAAGDAKKLGNLSTELQAVETTEELFKHVNITDFTSLSNATTVVRSGGARAINNIKMLVNEKKALVIAPKANTNLAKNVDDYVAAFKNGNSARQGQLGEDIAELIAKELDNSEVLNVKINNSGHGFDVLQFENGINNPTLIRMFESKPLNGTSIELPMTNEGVQMGNLWQNAKIGVMRESSNLSVKSLGDVMFQNQRKIERYVLTIDKELKQVIIIRLDNF